MYEFHFKVASIFPKIELSQISELKKTFSRNVIGIFSLSPADFSFVLIFDIPGCIFDDWM